MRCLHCGKPISFLRKFSDTEFCSNAHRSAYVRVQEEMALRRLRESGNRLDSFAPVPPTEAPLPRPRVVGQDPPEAGMLSEAIGLVQRKTLHVPGLRPLTPQFEPESPASPLGLPPNLFTRVGLLPESGPAAIGLPGEVGDEAVAGYFGLPGAVQPALALAVDLHTRAGLPLGEGVPAPAPFPLPPGSGRVLPPVVHLTPRRPEPQSGPAFPAGSLPPKPVLAPVQTVTPTEAGPPPLWSGLFSCQPPEPAAPAGQGVRSLPPVWLAPSAPGVHPGQPSGLTAPTLGSGTTLPLAAAATPWHGAAGPVPEARPLWRRRLAAPGAGLRVHGAQPATGEAMALELPPLAGGILPLRTPQVAIQTGHAAEPECARFVLNLGAEPEPLPAGLALLAALPADAKRLQAGMNPTAALPVAGPAILPGTGARVEQVLTFEPLVVEQAPATEEAAAWDTAPAEPAFSPESAGVLAGALMEEAAVEESAQLEARPREEDPAGGPAMLTRVLPILPGRPVGAGRTGVYAPATQAVWFAPLEAEPLVGGTRLSLDHADGSGPRRIPIAVARKASWLARVWRPRLPRWGGAWRHAPADLKWVSLAIPAVLFLVVYSLIPSQPITKPGASESAVAGDAQHTVLGERFSVLRKVIMDRAAIRLVDDFRGGLGAWSGAEGWARTWQYDAARFVSPGRLALYQPTVPMRDYEVSFLAQIDRRSLNWVIRAADERNYLAMRIVITQPGPLPKASIVRYAVIDGRPGPLTTLPLPLSLRTDTLYRVRMEIRGDQFVTYVQDQIVDRFTDDRFPEGGVGFFSPPGDRALLRWVSVMHQYDYLGRLCAVLTPLTAQAEGRRLE